MDNYKYLVEYTVYNNHHASNGEIWNNKSAIITKVPALRDYDIIHHITKTKIYDLHCEDSLEKAIDWIRDKDKDISIKFVDNVLTPSYNSHFSDVSKYMDKYIIFVSKEDATKMGVYYIPERNYSELHYLKRKNGEEEILVCTPPGDIEHLEGYSFSISPLSENVGEFTKEQVDYICDVVEEKMKNIIPDFQLDRTPFEREDYDRD